VQVLEHDRARAVALFSRPMMAMKLDAATTWCTKIDAKEVQGQPRKRLTFWRDIPSEVKIMVFAYLNPRDIIRSSRVSRGWHQTCYDGQLWSSIDTEESHKGIPVEALMMIITKAGPFVRDLNLCGVQMRKPWNINGLPEACVNLRSLSLKDCRVERTAIHSFLTSKNTLVHIDLSGLAAATNYAMHIIAADCHKLEYLHISGCKNIDTSGLQKVIRACLYLKDIRAGEVGGWGDVDFMQQLFLRNGLECLILEKCNSLTNESLAVLIEGKESERCSSTGRPIVPPRKLKHLDLHQCLGISDSGVCRLVSNVPQIESLRLSKCHGISDGALIRLLPTTPVLIHLELERLEALTNAVLHSLASSPCARDLRYLNVSDCEAIDDIGVLSLLRSCTGLQSLDLDNTNISDRVLVQAAAMVRRRAPRANPTGVLPYPPTIGLFLRAHECPKVTWTGIREILSHNAEVITTDETAQMLKSKKEPINPSETVTKMSSSQIALNAQLSLSKYATLRTQNEHKHAHPTQIVAIHMDFYTYQQIIDEHTRRVLRVDLPAARRLELRSAEFVVAHEKMAAGGGRRRLERRRVREAQQNWAYEMGLSNGTGASIWKRLGALTGGCTVM